MARTDASPLSPTSAIDYNRALVSFVRRIIQSDDARADRTDRAAMPAEIANACEDEVDLTHRLKESGLSATKFQALLHKHGISYAQVRQPEGAEGRIEQLITFTPRPPKHLHCALVLLGALHPLLLLCALLTQPFVASVSPVSL